MSPGGPAASPDVVLVDAGGANIASVQFALARLGIDAPLTASFGVSTIISYSKVNSTIPNYRTDNFSVSFGPTARF